MRKGPKNLALVGAFWLAMSLFIAVEWLQWRGNERLLETAEWVARTHDAEADLHALMAQLERAETAAHGLLLTGDESFVAPYEAGAQRVPQLHKGVLALLRDEDQKADVGALWPLIERRLALLQTEVELHRNGNPEAARRAVIDGGRAVMDRIRAEADRILHRQRLLLQQRTAAASAEEDRVERLALGGSLFGIFTLCAVFVATMREQKLRRDADRALRLREAELARFKSALDQTLDPMFLFRADDLRFTYANRGATALFGFEHAELLGMRALDLKPDSAEAELRQHLQALLDGSELAALFATTCRAKNGQSVPVEVLLQLVHEPGQTPALFVCIVRDLRSSERAHQLLRLERDRLSLALEAAALAPWEADWVSGRLTLGQRWAELIGADQVARISAVADLLPIIPADEHARLRAAVADTIAGRTPDYHVEHPIRDADGRWRWIESHGRVVERSGDGRVLRVAGVARDISERKRDQQALIDARDAAQRANAAKDEFLATMSHEIRTPLSAMLGTMELLALSGLSSEQREALELARDSGRGLVRIIDDVLDDARLNAGKLQIKVEPIGIAQIVERVQRSYQALAGSKQLALVRAVDPRIGPALLADPVRLAQILGNLVSNAIKFTPSGHVELAAELLSRDPEAATERVRLSVSDTGTGLGAEVMARLFEPFEQAAVDASRQHGGTGLGLSISRRLATMMGGLLDMQSRPGQGTRVSLTLTLPIVATPPEGIAPITEPAAVGQAPTAQRRGSLVLVVDDHPINRLVLEWQLEAIGLRVESAADGASALAMWRAGSYALVVTDCNMLGMDGYALCRAIREIEAGEGRPRTPVVAWTANVMPEAALQCSAAGMDDRLTKPADLATLKQMVDRWLPGGSRTLPSAAPEQPPLAHDVVLLGELAASAAEQAEILHDYLRQSRLDLAQLELALGRADVAACWRIAHHIKGASQMVGANEMAAASGLVEQAAQQGAMADLRALRAALERLERLVLARTGRGQGQQGSP